MSNKFQAAFSLEAYNVISDLQLVSEIYSQKRKYWLSTDTHVLVSNKN